ncbi:putative DNA polymerase iota [Aspergillus homomorphus CBS 101889]|uniref:Putative DNA polymerase iota n=1 Tax=Aspergillus homomorphus (strain CBS 101889) TaxID=1450537 RepID=A0A395IH62_ASPHC|nr:putative DNA polymerase iota [Aspergillus homomorphus CBS 101889]RAL17544.1 putative DNA polymerase iota [Aspergillus homomorphus CBS 101889]
MAKAPSPSRNDQRVILHFDYDCFYAAVFEVEQPVLKTLPLAVQQKQIVVTCNYEARRRGLRKLQLIKEAKQVCPDVVIVLGEDLTRFRDASKRLFLYLRSFVWGAKVERLGFDELFLDVTEMIDYNVDLLNRHDLEHSFFHLDRQEPTVGFTYNATQVHGSTYPADLNPTDVKISSNGDVSGLYTRLLVASHLAGFLRGQLEFHMGYTATVGISTSKLLAKLVGNTHKPNNQTILLPPYLAHPGAFESNVAAFLDAHEIRKIPGLGSKLTRKIIAYLTKADAQVGSPPTSDLAKDLSGPKTVRDVRLCSGMGPALLDRILGGPGAPRDIGARVWGLLNGVDPTPVVPAGDIPTQISIEDTYGRLDTLEIVRRKLITLTASLLRRMRTDLIEEDLDIGTGSDQPVSTMGAQEKFPTRWRARPRTLRLSTRLRPSGTEGRRPVNRASRSEPLPAYVFSMDESIDAIAERLVHDSILSMFRRLHPEKSGWDLQLMNVAVTNMIEGAGDRKDSSGRDIGKMFQTQATGTKEFFSARVMKTPISATKETSTDSHLAVSPPGTRILGNIVDYVLEDAGWQDSDGEEGMSCIACDICGASIPYFAREAHVLYHSAPD